MIFCPGLSFATRLAKSGATFFAVQKSISGPGISLFGVQDMIFGPGLVSFATAKI
jgi:hypothetical protein